MYHFPLETSSSSSVFIISHPAPKLETLDSSDSPSSHRVLSVLQPRSLGIQLLPPLHSLLPNGCQEDLSEMQIWLFHSPYKTSRTPRLRGSPAYPSTRRNHTILQSWLQPWGSPTAAPSNVWPRPPGTRVNASLSSLLRVTSSGIFFHNRSQPPLLDSTQLSPLWSSLLRPPNYFVASSLYLENGLLEGTWVSELDQKGLENLFLSESHGPCV